MCTDWKLSSHQWWRGDWWRFGAGAGAIDYVETIVYWRRSEVVEGVVVEENSVIAMGVYLSQSTKIYNRMTDTVSYGRIPANSVVVPGSLRVVVAVITPMLRLLSSKLIDRLG